MVSMTALLAAYLLAALAPGNYCLVEDTIDAHPTMTLAVLHLLSWLLAQIVRLSCTHNFHKIPHLDQLKHYNLDSSLLSLPRPRCTIEAIIESLSLASNCIRYSCISFSK